MIRTVVCALLLALPASATDPEVATVLVHGTTGPGSGAVVHTDGRASLVLTNRHVCPHDGQIQIRHAGKLYPATWLGADAQVDIAVLRVDRPLPALRLADEEPARHTPVRLFGYGGDSKAGRVTGRDGTSVLGEGPRWYMTLVSQAGDSGAPVVDSQDRVVALNCGFITMRDGSRIGYGVPLAEVRRVIRRHVEE